MNNKKISIVVAAVAVLAITWFVFGGRGGTISVGPTDGVFTGSVMDLMKRGGNYKCTYSVSNESGQFEGVTYVSGQKVRTDTTSRVVANGMSLENYMIVDPEFTYIWSPMMPQGIKIATPKDQQAAPEPSAAQGQMADYNQQVDYRCAPWTPDQSVFTPPANISFQSL